MSEILKLSLKAQIPVVRVTSDDPDNLENLLRSMSTRPVIEATTLGSKPNRWKQKTVYYAKSDTVLEADIVYDILLEREITLVVVNSDPDQWERARDCGHLTPSIEYIQSQLEGWLAPKHIKKYGRYFAGMSLKDTVETIMLTQTRDGTLTATGINETKSYLGAGIAGLESLDTLGVEDYEPPAWAEEWLQYDAPLLDIPKYQPLWPKGFMLHGPSGTGKTMMAAYIANKLGWPLYRLDLGALYSRWQGDSERNLRRVLSFISSQGESVFLLDEAEKLFGNASAGQASLSTLLSMLLWWLQGQSNRTVTVMTSNNIEVIPPELYRPGRLDAVHEMRGIEPEDMDEFLSTVVAKMAATFELDAEDLLLAVPERYFAKTEATSQATVVSAVRSAAKRLIIEGETKC